MSSAEHLNNLVKESKDADLTSLSKDADSLLKERKDVLLGMYCESRTEARHYENKRATVSNIIMLATVGLVGYIHHLDYEDWPLTLAIALVGVFGAVFTKYYFDSISRFETRADGFRNALDTLLFERPEPDKHAPNTLREILANADEVDVSEPPRVGKPPRMTWFRMYWPLFIALFALGFTIYALFFCEPTPKPSQLIITYTAGDSQQEKK